MRVAQIALRLAAASLCTAAHALAQGPVSLVTDPRPLVSFGVEDGAEPYMFSGIAGALRLPTGFLVANCGSGELRFFDPKGVHLRSSGGRGGGPGEFQYLRRVFPAGGDSVGVFDGVPGLRVSLFSGDGKFVRSFPVPNRSLDVMGRTRDGSFIARTRGPAPTTPGIHRQGFTIVRLTADGALVDSIAGLPGFEGIVRVDRRPVFAARLGRAPVIAILTDGIAYGGQESAEFTEFTADLKVRRRVATFSKPELVTAALKERFESGRGVMFPNGGVVGAFGADYADSAPAYKDIVAGADGRIWVQDPARPSSYPLVWTSYRDGRVVSRVELPPRFFALQFGSDWVLGVQYDANSVERVQLLAIKPGAHSGKSVTPRDGEPPAQPRCGAWTAR